MEVRPSANKYYFLKVVFSDRNTEKALILKRQAQNSRISRFRPSKFNFCFCFLCIKFEPSFVPLTWLEKSEFQCASRSFSNDRSCDRPLGIPSRNETYLYMFSSLFTSTILLDLIKQVLIYCDSFVIVWIKQ